VTQPLTIGPRNAVAATGCTWEWVADQAERLGVPFLGTKKKRVVNAAALLAALEAERAKGESEAVADPAAEVRRRIGLVRRTA
jgi:hypothetical protein